MSLLRWGVVLTGVCILTLVLLFLLRSFSSPSSHLRESVSVHPWERVPIYVINLPERQDRRERITRELKRVGWYDRAIFLEAVKNSNGALGCGQSHVKALRMGIASGHEHVLIMEDDFVFDDDVNEDTLRQRLREVWNSFSTFRILLLAGNYKKGKVLTHGVHEVHYALTTSAYFVPLSFIPTLLKCFEKAVELLAQGTPVPQAAIDVQWRVFQGPGQRFYYCRVGHQGPSFSDIEQRHVDYKV